MNQKLFERLKNNPPLTTLSVTVDWDINYLTSQIIAKFLKSTKTLQQLIFAIELDSLFLDCYVTRDQYQEYGIPSSESETADSESETSDSGSNFEISETSAIPIIEAMQINTSVTSLTLPNGYITNEHTEIIISLVEQNRKLSLISNDCARLLSKETYKQDEMLADLTELMKKLSNLNKNFRSGIHSLLEVVNVVATGLKAFEKIYSLKLLRIPDAELDAANAKLDDTLDKLQKLSKTQPLAHQALVFFGRQFAQSNDFDKAWPLLEPSCKRDPLAAHALWHPLLFLTPDQQHPFTTSDDTPEIAEQNKLQLCLLLAGKTLLKPRNKFLLLTTLAKLKDTETTLDNNFSIAQLAGITDKEVMIISFAELRTIADDLCKNLPTEEKLKEQIEFEKLAKLVTFFTENGFYALLQAMSNLQETASKTQNQNLLTLFDAHLSKILTSLVIAHESFALDPCSYLPITNLKTLEINTPRKIETVIQFYQTAAQASAELIESTVMSPYDQRLEKLLQIGADNLVTRKQEYYETLLKQLKSEVGESSIILELVKQQQYYLATIFLEKFPDMPVTGSDPETRYTALHLAVLAEVKQPKLVYFLCPAGANIRTESTHPLSTPLRIALWHAAQTNDYGIVNIMINALSPGQDLDVLEVVEHISSKSPALKKLQQKSADNLEAPILSEPAQAKLENFGPTLFDLVKQQRYESAVELLKYRNVVEILKSRASEQVSLSDVMPTPRKLQVIPEMSVNYQNPSGFNALQLTVLAKPRKSELIRLLCQAGADIGLKFNIDEQGNQQSILQIAFDDAARYDYSIIKIFLAHALDPATAFKNFPKQQLGPHLTRIILLRQYQLAVEILEIVGNDTPIYDYHDSAGFDTLELATWAKPKEPKLVSLLCRAGAPVYRNLSDRFSYGILSDTILLAKKRNDFSLVETILYYAIDPLLENPVRLKADINLLCRFRRYKLVLSFFTREGYREQINSLLHDSSSCSEGPQIGLFEIASSSFYPLTISLPTLFPSAAFPLKMLFEIDTHSKQTAEQIQLTEFLVTAIITVLSEQELAKLFSELLLEKKHKLILGILDLTKKMQKKIAWDYDLNDGLQQDHFNRTHPKNFLWDYLLRKLLPKYSSSPNNIVIPIIDGISIQYESFANHLSAIENLCNHIEQSNNQIMQWHPSTVAKLQEIAAHFIPNLTILKYFAKCKSDNHDKRTRAKATLILTFLHLATDSPQYVGSSLCMDAHQLTPDFLYPDEIIPFYASLFDLGKICINIVKDEWLEVIGRQALQLLQKIPEETAEQIDQKIAFLKHARNQSLFAEHPLPILRDLCGFFKENPYRTNNQVEIDQIISELEEKQASISLPSIGSNLS